jgi:hypothetical protein
MIGCNMATAPIRPTTEVSDVILDSMDQMFEQLRARLVGLTDEEYLWEPAEGCWSVRPDAAGSPIIDRAGDRYLDPAPVTTIAWRLWHLSIDCLDDYTRRFGGDTTDSSAEWTLNAEEAVRTLEKKWAAYRSVVVARDWWDQLGGLWDHWSASAVADMAMHASNELVHHGAEIALLRDLYRASTPC